MFFFNLWLEIWWSWMVPMGKGGCRAQPIVQALGVSQEAICSTPACKCFDFVVQLINKRLLCAELIAANQERLGLCLRRAPRWAAGTSIEHSRYQMQ